MENYVKIKKGSIQPIQNAIFLSKASHFGKKGPFVTVDGSSLMGEDATKIRVLVKSSLDVIPLLKKTTRHLCPLLKKKSKKRPRRSNGQNQR